MSKAGEKMIQGLTGAVEHMEDYQARAVGKLVKELCSNLYGNGSFSEVKISKKAGKIQAVIVYSSGVKATILEPGE